VESNDFKQKETAQQRRDIKMQQSHSKISSRVDLLSKRYKQHQTKPNAAGQAGKLCHPLCPVPRRAQLRRVVVALIRHTARRREPAFRLFPANSEL